MVRVAGLHGMVHLCVPSPSFVPATRDWGFADKSKSYHYRAYGADAGLLFLQACPDAHAICGVGRDSATEAYEFVYWLSRDSAPLLEVTTLLQRAQIPVVVVR